MVALMAVWTSPSLACANGSVGETAELLAGVMRCNTNAQSMGCGCAARSYTRYCSKYVTKVLHELKHSAATLIRANELCRQYTRQPRTRRRTSTPKPSAVRSTSGRR